MTQGTAMQALARGAIVLDSRHWQQVAESALGAFDAPPPTGVGRRGAGRPALPHVLVRPRPADPQRRPAGDHGPARPRRPRWQPGRPRALPRAAKGAVRQADAALRHRRLVAVLAGRPRVDARLPPARRRVPRQPLQAHPPAPPTAPPTCASPATSASRRGSASPARAGCAPGAPPACASRSPSSPPSTFASPAAAASPSSAGRRSPAATTRVTWTPPARGRYRITVVGAGPSGPSGAGTQDVRVVLPKPKPKKPKADATPTPAGL